MSRCILALNCGSSSLKFGLYESGPEDPALLADGEAQQLGTPQATLSFRRGKGEKISEQLASADHEAALEHALHCLDPDQIKNIAAVGHRIVHGGADVQQHQLLTPAVLEKLRAAVSFAPLHVPPALKAIDAVSGKLPNVPQIVCLDTAFHRTLPDVSRTFALPAKVRALGVRRYGFHGLSLESILHQMPVVPARLVVAHLGGGCSITAIDHGLSIDTTMGFTPTGGMMMGTRCGDLDPGVMLFLLRHGSSSADKLEKLVDKASGLLGVSGLSSDMRELEKEGASSPPADLARRMFAYQLRQAVASMTAAMNGLDTLIFTGGIGEHDRALRDEVSSSLSFLGKFAMTSLPSMEDLQIARITDRLAFA